MADTIFTGSEVKLRVSYTGSPNPPVSLPTVTLIDSSNVSTTLGTSALESTGVYFITWTPGIVGNFTVRFSATFPGSGTPLLTDIHVSVAQGATTSTTASITLGEDTTVYFMSDLTPMIIDADQFTILFPDADQIEIAELINYYSLEAYNIMDLDYTMDPPTLLMTEFVQASVACALTRIYDTSGGADTSTTTLGDLTVTRGFSAKANVTRANATTWCQLAAVIRDELYRFSSKSGLKVIVKGDRVRSLLPCRELQHQEWRIR